MNFNIVEILNILFSVITFILFGLIIKFLPFFRGIQGINYKQLLFVFFVKCAAGFVFIYIYGNYYDIKTGDVFSFFKDGMLMADVFWKNPLDYLRMLTGIDAGAEHLSEYYAEMSVWYRPWEEPMYNDNRVVIRFNAIIGIISGGNIGIHSIVANFLSFTGIFAIVKFMKDKISNNKLHLVFWGVFFFPSVLFWSSGILKENFLLFALGIFLLKSDQLFIRRLIKPINVIIFLFSLLLLLILKAYVFLLIIPLIITYYLFKNKENFSIIGIYASIYVLWILVLWIAGYIYLGYDPIHVISSKQNSFVLYSIHVQAGSLISNRLMEPNIISLLSFIPEGFWNTLTRPHLLDGKSYFIIAAALENIFIWIIVLYIAFFYIKKRVISSISLFCILFFIVTFIFVGMVAPIYGSLVRYKMPALPFLWIAFVYIIDFDKIKKLNPLHLKSENYKNNE